MLRPIVVTDRTLILTLDDVFSSWTRSLDPLPNVQSRQRHTRDQSVLFLHNHKPRLAFMPSSWVQLPQEVPNCDGKYEKFR